MTAVFEVIQEVYSGVTVGASHILWYVKNVAEKKFIQPASTLFGVNTPALKASTISEQKGKFEVIGVGYGRTGTYSLTLALEQLGYPTLHTQHMYESPAILDMWTQDVFLPAIDKNELTLGTPDFDVITAHGYTATADLPMALYFEQINELYPECKFILTSRENSEVWFRSWDVLTKSISQTTHVSVMFPHVRQIAFYLRWLYGIVNHDKTFLKTPIRQLLPNQIKHRAIASYEDHNRRVREVIPAERLLEFDVRDGWEPLCSFLEIANCPATSFPKTNTARSVQVQAVSAFLFPLTVVLFVLFYFFVFVFQKATGQTVLRWAETTRIRLLESLSGLLSQKREKQMKTKSKKFQ